MLESIMWWSGIRPSICPLTIGFHAMTETNQDWFQPYSEYGYILLGCEIYNHLMEDILTP